MYIHQQHRLVRIGDTCKNGVCHINYTECVNDICTCKGKYQPSRDKDVCSLS